MSVQPQIRPTIIVDTREQDPLPLTCPTARAGLYSGDYSYRGGEIRFAIERKSVADLVSSVGAERERFENELHRLRGFDFARLLVIGTREEIEAGRYRSRMSPKAVLSSLNAFEVRYRVPVVFAASPEEGAELVERWAYWHAREASKIAEALTLATTPEAPNSTSEMIHN